jgi:hypothetical protein
LRAIHAQIGEKCRTIEYRAGELFSSLGVYLSGRGKSLNLKIQTLEELRMTNPNNPNQNPGQPSNKPGPGQQQQGGGQQKPDQQHQGGQQKPDQQHQGGGQQKPGQGGQSR